MSYGVLFVSLMSDFCPIFVIVMLNTIFALIDLYLNQTYINELGYY